MIEKHRSLYIRSVEIAVIVIISGLVYLPSLAKATVYRDDWYYMMDRLMGGHGIFESMFQIDRPARAPLFEAYFQLFGTQPLPYHLSSYFWRLLGGLGAYWLFNLLWPKNRQACFYMALLFTLYPGYLRWMEGFEDQPQILSLFLMVFSIALTIKAITVQPLPAKIGYWLGAIITGCAYLALVDFAIGMEFFRLLCVVIVLLREQKDLPPLKKYFWIFRCWAPAILIPGVFLVWRMFIFHNQREATDVGLQLSFLANSPILTGLTWISNLFLSTVNTAFQAWVLPQFQQLFALRLTEIGIGILLALLAILLIYLANAYLLRLDQQPASLGEPQPPPASWRSEAVVIGLAGVIAGLLAVTIANRYVTFESFSHYALPASLASACLIVGLLFYISDRRLRLIVISFLVGCALLTHYVYSMRVLAEERSISDFWHQVAWRAPGIRPGTSLLVNYPGVNYGEDIDAVAGPANYIYYPQETDQNPVNYPLSTLPQMRYTINNVLTGGSSPRSYRTHTWSDNFDNILVISQPSRSSCVRFIDRRWPYYSTDDQYPILATGSRSKIDNVITDGEPPILDEKIFGPEPVHSWCYYFEKASLAVQQGDWQKAVDLGNEALDLGLHPIDRVEWMPFLQANAVMGNAEKFKTLHVKMDDIPFDRLQACNVLNLMQKDGLQFTAEIQGQISGQICQGLP
jgi:hypothetical protein